MPFVAEFEERQYEFALTHELAASSTSVFAPGQVLESLIGFDVALEPGDRRIWRLLEAGAPPGVLLTPTLWKDRSRLQQIDFPPYLVSLVLQVKRPEYLDHWKAGQNHHWKGPYYRFHLRDGQQHSLEQLERATQRRALASAAFVTRAELYQHQASREVARHSAFVPPLPLQGHRLWSYAASGTVGYANPDPAVIEGDSAESLLSTAASVAVEETLEDHLRGLAQ